MMAHLRDIGNPHVSRALARTGKGSRWAEVVSLAPCSSASQSSAKVNQPASPGPGKSFPVKEAVLVQIRLLQMLPTSPFEKLVSISVMVSSIPSHGSTKEAVVHVNAV